MTDELKLHPIWKQAALEAVSEFDYGDVIPLTWIREHLEIEEPEGLMTMERHRELSFDLLSKVDGFRTEMLENHKRMTVNVRSVGYKVVHPVDQTDAAMKRFQREFYKSWSNAMSNLIHINDSMISLEDARANAEAKAKLAWFKNTGTKRIESKDQDDTTPDQE